MLPRFFVSSEILAGSRAILGGAEFHHLRVRRLQVGHAVVLFDGLGRQRQGIVVDIDKQRAQIDLQVDPSVQRESPLHLVLAPALLKGDKLDLVIEKAVELGVSELRPFTCERSISQASAARRDRWIRIARGAAKQCQRSVVPDIAAPLPFDELLSSTTAAVRLLFWEHCPPTGLEVPAPQPPTSVSVLAAVGPEGGFTAAETDRAMRAGFRLVGLGPRILRAETAAIAAVTLCQFLWGDLGRGPG